MKPLQLLLAALVLRVVRPALLERLGRRQVLLRRARLFCPAGSLVGRFGNRARAIAIDLLQRGWVTVIASDAHNLEHRPPELEPGRGAAAKIVGEIEAWKLVREVPLSIIGRVPELVRTR